MDMAADPYNLQRFVDAQQQTFYAVRAELLSGQKRTHWMWFIFPQLRGLGSSAMAVRFAISTLQEGAAYLEHPVLGPRLQDCTALVNAIPDRSLSQVFDSPDDLKFHSSMTLFAKVAGDLRFDAPGFQDALAKYFAGRADLRTLSLLSRSL